MQRLGYCWELGGKLGHLRPYNYILSWAHSCGLKVDVMTPNPEQARKVFQAFQFNYVQCPVYYSSTQREANCFSHVMTNSGMGEASLRKRVEEWRTILSGMDLVIVDHSPTALLALRSLGIPAIVCGTGYFIPPKSEPFPYFPDTTGDPVALLEEEQALLRNLNTSLSAFGAPLLENLSELFYGAGVTRVFRTFPEFDHYQLTRSDCFLGVPPDFIKDIPVWPESQRHKVFAYIDVYPYFEVMLRSLSEFNTIVASATIDKQSIEQFDVTFSTPNFDVVQAGKASYFAVTNANLTTSIKLLLQGCPLILVPTQREQRLVAHNLERMGVAIYLKESSKFPEAVSQMLDKYQTLKRNAVELADKYKDYQDNYVDSFCSVISKILGGV